MTHQLGDLLVQQASGQQFGYRLLSIEPYRNRFGFQSALLTWHATCACCGRQFEAKSGRRPRYLPRTCPDHRRMLPGSSHGEGSMTMGRVGWHTHAIPLMTKART